MATRRTYRTPVVLVLLLGTMLLVGARLAYVHAHTWDWSLRPTATAPKLEYVNRTYLCGAAQLKEPDGVIPVGQTIGGGVILAPRDSANAPTVVYVRADSRLTAYSLSGGP